MQDWKRKELELKRELVQGNKEAVEKKRKELLNVLHKKKSPLKIKR